MCVTPIGPLVDHRPAKKRMVRRKLTCMGAEVGYRYMRNYIYSKMNRSTKIFVFF